MSATRTRDLAVAVDDTATLHYADRSMTGTVTEVVRFRQGPRAGRIWKIAVRPADAPSIFCWFVPARDRSGKWISVGGATTLTF